MAAHDALGQQFRGKVVRLRSLHGAHPDFADSGGRYYVEHAGDMYGPARGDRVTLHGIPGHTNGRISTNLSNVEVVKEHVKKYPR